ncbi:MAG: amidohydrolase family protein [Elusimicrobia bacterium]|nr:amidohydrolase family protein [Elusimicrobiota bacterium]
MKIEEVLKLRIIDAHTHLSLYENDATSLEDTLKLLLADMNKNSVGYAIVIPDNIENDPRIADLNKARNLIAGNDRLFLLGSPQILQRGSSELNKYEKLIKNKVVKGIKFFPGHDDYYPIDERCNPYYEICQSLNVPVIFHTGINTKHSEVARFNDPKHIVKVAKRYPKLKVIITHYFWPKMKYCYEITKNIPNIYFETAGMGDSEVITASGGVGVVKEILSKTITDREDQVLFGTDWPMCKIEDHINLIKSLNLAEKVEAKIFAGNANRVYRLGIL